MRRTRFRPLGLTLLFLLALLVWAPLTMLLGGALTPTSSLGAQLGGVLGEGDALAFWRLLPERLTLRHVVELLIDTPAFYRVFWNSCRQVLPGVCLQALIGAPAAWALSQFRFPGRGALLWLYVLLMILPFQVTMAPSYIVLDRLGLIDTSLAITLPMAFSAFPVFIMSKFFSKIPKDMLEAARIDGAGEWRLFFTVGLPLGLPGVLSAMLLGFVEGWNAVEQPFTFLKTPALYPLSVFLPRTTVANAGVSFVSALVALLPAALIFLVGQRYLEQGILASGIKE